MTDPIVKRCTADERKALTAWARGCVQITRAFGVQIGEPAMGTVDERLGIIIRRLGGTTSPVRMTADERRELGQYLTLEGVE